MKKFLRFLKKLAAWLLFIIGSVNLILELIFVALLIFGFCGPTCKIITFGGQVVRLIVIILCYYGWRKLKN